VINGDIRLYLGGLNALNIFTTSTAAYRPVHEAVKFFLEDGTVQANALSKLTFAWMNGLISKGYKNKKLSEDDIPNPPAALDPTKSYTALRLVWESQKKKSLLFALVRVFGWTVATAVFFELLNDILSFVSPQLLRLLIKFFGDETQPIIVGFLIAFGLFTVSIMETSLYNKFFISIYEAAMGTKSSLMSLIYHKALKLSTESKKERTTGDIVNIMSVDVNRVQDLANQFQMLVSAPMKLVLCLVSLYDLLGGATLAGVVTMAIMIPINTLLSKRVRSLFKSQMKYKDARTQTTSELLTGIKSIKLYAIEKVMLEKLAHVRNDLELANLKRISVYMAIITFLWNCVPFLVSCSTFTVFAVFFDRPLTPEIVFPALALFDLLSEPIYTIPSVITALIETAVSFERITKFLECEEIHPELLKHFDRVEEVGQVAVKVDNCTFLWETIKKKKKKSYDEESIVQGSKVALVLDGFEAKKGKLSCIVGRVGSGKSTFLQSLLGYLPCVGTDGTEPTIEIRGTIAYCSQVPWIMNATVKENILFGHRFDEEFYQNTLEACQLLPDLEILPDGDETAVGEKGISLSGGQKARLSLARAVYSRADLFLLDDILSAVDAHVGKSIIDEVINGLLSTKTVILATNSIPVLIHADQVLLLEGGKVVETGSYCDIVSTGSKLSNLISEFGSSNESSEPSDEEHEEKLARRKSISTIRRASVATFKQLSPISKGKKSAQTEEQSAVGKVSFRVYKEYAKACGYRGVLLFLILIIFTTSFSILANNWLKSWSEENDRNGSNKNVWKYVGVYAFFGIGSGLFTLARSIVMWLLCALKGSSALHDRMALSVIRSPMSFFETTPIGRIMNRFSSDVNKIDESLPRSFNFFFASTIKTVFILGFIGINMPPFLLLVCCLSVLYIYYQQYYIASSRDLKRIVSISRSPIFSHLQETLNGFETILAYNQADRFEFIHFANLSFNLKALYLFRSINRWLAARLQFMGSVIIFATSSMAVVQHLSPGMAGLLISYALTVTSSLSWIVRMTVEVETNIVSVERVLDYCDLPPEADEITDTRPPDQWPNNGSVEFDNYSTRYRLNLDPVLNGVSFKVEPKEKIGIVGRTGAGKSTLSLALFRMIEPTGGRILIDGLDITKLGLHDLRSNLAIIPQDSQAFEGTVRQNLDPIGNHTDEELWKALELAHLKPFIQSMNKESVDSQAGLEAKLSEGGSNMSVGQRQLLCLARALLNPSKVLILDEATASVDVETDKVVQETIRSEFKDRTILTIAHRIDTVMDSDKIAVLERGQVKEFDTPQNLLKDPDGLFFHLCVQGGYISPDASSS
jgi:ABC-type multidrug transport system fused ATPase/permease subunit